jgi:SAM-dependent methyltransferase
VGSRIDGFITHLLVFMPVTVVDIRPLSSRVPGLTFIQEDATTLASIPTSSVESLSSLNAVEHFGLGRYGDPVDPNACFKAMAALARVLKPGGRLYFSVPIGRERLEFNAQRVFSPRTIWYVFEREWGLNTISFAAVDDKGEFHEEATPEDFVHAEYSLGLWEFTKRGKDNIS